MYGSKKLDGKARGIMNKIVTAFALCAMVGSAHALSLVQVGPSPTGSSTLFRGTGTANTGNQKARLELAGLSTIQGGNPGNGWFYGNNPRSWEMSWNNTNKTVSWKLFSSSDWTGPEATNGLMNGAPVFQSGHDLVGLAFGRSLATDTSLNLDNIMFNAGSGWVDINSEEGLFTGGGFTKTYYAFNGTMTDWVLRGTANFPAGTTSSDSMRFFVEGVQAVPEPGTMVALGLGLAAMARRKRKAQVG